jgi:hypothetical protein
MGNPIGFTAAEDFHQQCTGISTSNREGGAMVVIIAMRAAEFESLYLEVSEALDRSIFVPTEAVSKRPMRGLIEICLYMPI